jgi:hypothetical protein
MRRRLIIVLAIMISIALISVASIALNRSPATVEACGGVGQIRIEPHSTGYPTPIMLSSPATFNITVTNGISCYPIILLVMTNASYQGLTGPVLVNWTGGSISFSKASFTSVHANNAYVPPNGTTNGARYRVSGLKEHLGVKGTADDTLWYAYRRFLQGPITTTPQTFTVTLPSTNPRMLVYALGKSSCSPCSFHVNCCPSLYDMKVPPSRPGLVVPDLAPVLLASASFSAFGLFAIKRKKE